jgi:hypothetical protein
VDPELVLVFEVVGTIDEFINAVKRIEGFEYLAELDEDGIDDPAFLDPDAEDQTPFGGSLYLLAANQEALAAVKALWDQYVEDETVSFPHRLGRWRELFRLLSDLRRWGPADRLRGTGALEDFRDRVEQGTDLIPAEIELWFRQDESRRSQAESAVRAAVRAAGGTVLARGEIEPIAYHAMLVTLPIAAIQPILDGRPQDVALIRADEIAFVRPEAQALVDLGSPSDTRAPFDQPADVEVSDEPPLVAVLDGLPLPTHRALDGRLRLDDPDDWVSEIPAADRQHGTAIAGLVVHGDQGSPLGPLGRRVYARPILKPIPTLRGTRECVPRDQLAIDLVYRCVLRMKDDAAGDPQAPDVRLVNLSVGDRGLPLGSTMSPWARLLDHLAYRFDLLFVVSAGNHMHPVVLPHPLADIDAMSDDELRQETVTQLVQGAADRRLLSPSETVSGITVGAAHADGCDTFVAGARRDLLPGPAIGPNALPSPVSAAGMGYRRMIKPDVLAPGGRVLFRRVPGALGPTTAFEPAPSDIEPGLRVATPSGIAGALDRYRFMQGTSGAAALVSHAGGHILETLAGLTGPEGSGVDPAAWAVLTKALLVHSCSWSDSVDELRAVLPALDAAKTKEAVSRFVGHGSVDPARSLAGDPRRATALGWGELGADEAVLFELPLPPSLAGVTGHRLLVVTLAAFPPIRPRDRRHRAAQLFIRPDQDTLNVSRRDSDWRSVRRGAVQHEVLTGDQAAVYVDGDTLKLQVNCRATVASMRETVPFGLAVTIESAANLPIHAEVATRLQARATARVRART